MPNGRSGGFRITLAQCRKLLHGLPGESRIGSVVRNRKATSVTATQLAQLLDRYGEEDFSVEEQDHAWYIAHLGADPKGWILIDEDSLLYEAFRGCHAEWLRRLPKGQHGL
ncbi:MAG: hypothetical protein ACLP7Q_15825 [Isosphaeraceae bacterium]